MVEDLTSNRPRASLYSHCNALASLVIFLAAFAHFMSVLHLVGLTIFQIFQYSYICYGKQ